MGSFALAILCFALAVSGRPMRRASFTKQNGEDAIALNNKFASLTASSPCNAAENACVGNKFAQCVSGKFVTTSCATGEICAALPLVNSAGTSIACTTQADLEARVAATWATGGSQSGAQSTTATNKAVCMAAVIIKARSKRGRFQGKPSIAVNAAAKAGNTKSSTAAKASGTSKSGGGDIQSSLTLEPTVIAKGFAQDGQAVQEAGQVASLTSNNNFINFCASTKQTITNGQQVKGGSCNPAPMGSIPSTSNMPSCKFSNPKNMDVIKENTAFDVTMNIINIETGNFVNAQTNYISAPQQLNAKGQIIGHSHVVIEELTSMTQTTPTNPTKFAFFLGLNAAAQNGVLTAPVAKGLPAGTYKLTSINTAANHQPVLVPIAQHGSTEDVIYFTVTADGKGDSGGTNNGTATKTTQKTSQSSSGSKKGTKGQ